MRTAERDWANFSQVLETFGAWPDRVAAEHGPAGVAHVDQARASWASWFASQGVDVDDAEQVYVLLIGAGAVARVAFQSGLCRHSLDQLRSACAHIVMFAPDDVRPGARKGE